MISGDKMKENKRVAIYNPEADAEWNKKNKDHRNYLTKRSVARNFIKKHATKEDLDELQTFIDERLENEFDRKKIQ